MRIFETASGFGPASEYNSGARPSGRPDIDTWSFRKYWKNRNFWIMCGIIGYLGGKDAYPVLVDGLKQLEYRGYDSAGVALVSDSGKLNVYKEKGKVSDLEDYIDRMPANVNKKVVENFIKAGALDRLPGNRRQKLAVYEQLVENVQDRRKTELAGQMSFFESG